MDIAVLIKQVPDTWSERQLRESDWTLDRDSVDAVIDEIDTRGVETALQLVEAHGGEVTVVTMGPDRATDALRKALAMGAHKAVHISDDGLAGSDALQTSAALAAAIKTLSVDLIITGNESTDGRTGSVPSMLAERLGLPQVTSVRTLEIDGTHAACRAGARRRLQRGHRHPAGRRLGHREDQRAAVPELQGHHGREEEAGDHHRSGDLGLDAAVDGPGQRVDGRRRRRPAAAPHRRREGHRRRHRRHQGRRVPASAPG